MSKIKQLERDIRLVEAQNTLLTQANKQLWKEKTATERIFSYAKTSLDAYSPITPPQRTPKATRRTTVESAVLLNSCYHIGETVDPLQMGGLNAYDFDIFTRRFQQLIDTTLSFTQENLRGYKFDELWFVHLGDAVSGIIHKELETSNCLNIVEQVTLGACVVAQGIRELCAVFPRVIFLGLPGNHGRTEQKYYFKNKSQVNWDHVFYNYLALFLRDQPNITFRLPFSFWAGFSIKNWFFHASHGDTIKSWNGIPFYGLNREVAKWSQIAAARGQFYHYYIRSHFHTRGSMQTDIGENILNGSLIGAGEYSIAIPGVSDPTQTLFGVHARHGKTWELPISVKDCPARARYKYDKSRAIGEQV